METHELKPWSGDTPLRGPEAPENDGHIEHLIQYLLSIHERFGNTAVTCDLQWGATALHKRDAQKKLIEEILDRGVESVKTYHDMLYPDQQWDADKLREFLRTGDIDES
jgi:hypothetical protein